MFTAKPHKTFHPSSSTSGKKEGIKERVIAKLANIRYKIGPNKESQFSILIDFVSQDFN